MVINLYRHILYISLLCAIVIGTAITMEYNAPSYCLPIANPCYSITYYAEFKPSNLIIQPLYMLTTFASFILWRGLFLQYKNAPRNKILVGIVYFKTINMIFAFLTFHNTGYEFFVTLHFITAVFMFLIIMFLQIYVTFSKHYGPSTAGERWVALTILILPSVTFMISYIIDIHMRLFLEWVYVFLIALWYAVSTKRWKIKLSATRYT